MSTDKETSTDVKPKKTWLMFHRRQKMSSCEARAVPQEAEERHDSCASPGMQAAAPQSRAAAPHSPSRPPTPPPTLLEALGGQGAGAELGAVPTTADGEEKACSSPKTDWEASSPKELSQGEQDPEQSCRSGEAKPPVRPHEAWVEHSNLPPCTASGQASALPSRASHSGAETSSSETILDHWPPSPSASQVEARRQWAIATARILLAGLQSEEGDSSEDVQGSSSGDESVCVPCEYEPKPLEPCKGTGLLELTPQNGDQPDAKEEDGKSKELPEETCTVIALRTIWVNPLYPQLLVHPDTPLEEEADEELPSTSHALAAPRDTQPAAAAPEDEEHPVHATALTEEVAETAASAGPGGHVAAAESRAATPHGPRACGQALLHSLQRSSRAILSRVAAVIRRRSHQPGTQQHLHQGMEAGTAARAPAAGAESREAAPHSPCSPSSPSPTPLEALGGQEPGAAEEAALPLPADEQKACLPLEPDWEGDSPEETSQG